MKKVCLISDLFSSLFYVSKMKSGICYNEINTALRKYATSNNNIFELFIRSLL